MPKRVAVVLPADCHSPARCWKVPLTLEGEVGSMSMPSDPSGMPSIEAMTGVLAELKESLRRVPETHERLAAVTGMAWSDDRMVKVTVGPRGQLIDLDIDPRVFRQPDVQALRESILAANHTAVDRVLAQAQEIMMGELPLELVELQRKLLPDDPSPMADIVTSDRDMVAKRSAEHGDLS